MQGIKYADKKYQINLKVKDFVKKIYFYTENKWMRKKKWKDKPRRTTMFSTFKPEIVYLLL